MQRMMEMFAIMDYIKMAVEHKDYTYLNTEPFATIFDTWSGIDVFTDIDKVIQAGDYQKAVEEIEDFERKRQNLYRIYQSIRRDHQNLNRVYSSEDILQKIKEKFGIPDGEELMTLLHLQQTFLEEHEYI